MRRIVFVNQATGYLAIDIINGFVKDFDEVAVIYGDIREQDVRLDPKVKCSRVVEKSRTSHVKRFLKWGLATFQIYLLLITKYRKYEIFYFSVPPFAYLLSLLLRRRFSILMWDVYPDVLKNAGVSERNTVYKIWANANRNLFKRAFCIYTIGKTPAELMSKYITREKISIIPLWNGLRDYTPPEREENPFISANALKGKFIVQYSGNMGITHNIEVLLEVAKNVRHRHDIVFQFVGRGQKWNYVKYEIEKLNLENCRILPFQPDDLVKYSLSAADVSVVLVEPGASQMVVPSKVYNLLAIGSPIMAISPSFSELHNLIEKYDCGASFTGDEIMAMTSFILKLQESPDLISRFRTNAIKASRDFSPLNALEFYRIYQNQAC